MQPTKSSPMTAQTTAYGKRRAWRRPTVTKLSIGAQTKTARADAARTNAEPLAPAAPAGKFGFSFEMSLPMSARTSG
jgi:hypothetical protein